MSGAAAAPGAAAVARGEALGGVETLGDAVAAMARAFRAAGLDTPGLDARRVVMHVLALDAVEIVRQPERRIGLHERERLAVAMRRRLDREPVSRIVGRRDFHGLALEIGPATLDPRPETETLVDGVLGLMADDRLRGAPRILDLGVGSGAILIALLARCPAATGVGVDVSGEALQIAARNAAGAGVAERCEMRRSSWTDAVEGRFDLVVSNPPYIASGELARLEPEVRLHDPVGALDGGDDGLDAYRAIASGLGGVVAPGGWVVVEVGAGQAAEVGRILEQSPVLPLEVVAVWPDLSGVERCVAAKARSE